MNAQTENHTCCICGYTGYDCYEYHHKWYCPSIRDCVKRSAGKIIEVNKGKGSVKNGKTN